MKSALHTGLICIIAFLCLAAPASLTGQELCTVAEWTDDLDYLVQRLEITHPNPYSCVTKDEFYAAVERLRQLLPDLNESEKIIEFYVLVALLQDGHTNAYMPANDEKMWQIMHGFPINYYLFDDGLFIMSIDRLYEDAVGKEVKKVGKLPAAEMLRRTSQMVGCDNQTSKIRAGCIFLRCAEALRYFGAIDSVEALNLTLFEKDGKESTLTVDAIPFLESLIEVPRSYSIASESVATMNEIADTQLPLWLRNVDDNYWFEYLAEPRAVYVQVNSMFNKEDEDFGAFCRRLFTEVDKKGAERLIIDVRHNTGGSHIESPLLAGIAQRPHIDRTDALFLIIGPRTFSAAQHLTTLMEKNTRATLVGEPTGGRPNHFGSVGHFTLPNSGLGIQCSYYYYQDSEPWDYRNEVKPDIHIPLQSDDYRNNRDPVLEKIPEIGARHPLPDLKSAMQTAYNEGGFDAARQLYHEQKAAFREYGVSTEKEVTEFCKWLFVDREEEAEALELFNIILGSYPEACEIYETMGDCYREKGDMREAIRWYNKCLELCPVNADVRKRIALIELEESLQDRREED